MTIEIRRSTAAIVIALLGILGGFAIGQLTQAHSAQPKATASYVDPYAVALKEINASLKVIKQALGGTHYTGSIYDQLDAIRSNTYGACQAAGGDAFCHPFLTP
jgi:hypothetical protein